MNFRGGGYNVDKAEERGGKTRWKEGEEEEEEREAREARKIGEKSGIVAEGGGERGWDRVLLLLQRKGVMGSNFSTGLGGEAKDTLLVRQRARQEKREELKENWLLKKALNQRHVKIMGPNVR